MSRGSNGETGHVPAAEAANALPAKKVHSIQLMRAIAAMLVVLFHVHQAFAIRFTTPFFAAESYLFAFGAVGVHIFFVISGFIMVYTNPPGKAFAAKTFFRRRLLRIYPIYWLCAALYLAVHVLIGQAYALGLREAAGALLLLPGNASSIIGPAWTLAFEMYFYLCFGLAMLAGSGRGLTILIGFFTISVAAGAVVQIDHPAWTLVTSSLLLEFIAGAAIGWLLVSGKLPRRGGLTITVLAIILFGAGIAAGYERAPSVVMWGVPSVMLILGLAMHEAARAPSALVRKLGHFGDSSYALYLIHILLVTLAIELARQIPWLAEQPPALIAIPFALAALLVAEFLHHRVEKRMLGWLTPRRKSPLPLVQTGHP
ncbi:acyltransferase [Sphingopyxis sp.]|uniref:acyltransferase family protein n=1 Tax=Sphingopyxis sp. TaxID=1908224 RepID=UPI0025EA2938|nr:acyltransferase [Sphingopyxis sp.]